VRRSCLQSWEVPAEYFFDEIIEGGERVGEIGPSSEPSEEQFLVGHTGGAE